MPKDKLIQNAICVERDQFEPRPAYPCGFGLSQRWEMYAGG